MKSINERELKELIYNELKDLFSLCRIVVDLKHDQPRINRKVLGRMSLETAKCEEILDACGARSNLFWYPLRRQIATMKAFSSVTYALIHMEHAISDYCLLDIGRDYRKATDDMLRDFRRAYVGCCSNFLSIAKKMKLTGDLHDALIYDLVETQIPGFLEADKQRGDTEETREISIYLATTFLNLAEEAEYLRVFRRRKETEYETLFHAHINEESLRLLCGRFHNLQAVYDTYLLNSLKAVNDNKFPVLRGQISVVFHLLEMATTMVHFYERHCQKEERKASFISATFTPKEVLKNLVEFFFENARSFIEETQGLCKNLLKDYAVLGSIEVPIPCYRGFHVRPSTLLSRIVGHYGSAVSMFLGDVEYDASISFELFRANEEINRAKRCSIINEIIQHDLIVNDKVSKHSPGLMIKKLRMIFLELLEKSKIIVYDNDFAFTDIEPYADESLVEFVKRAIEHYTASYKIDLINTMKVTFKGDTRVLEDIKILAENGYGEDQYGNNISLPAELPYLKR